MNLGGKELSVNINTKRYQGRALRALIRMVEAFGSGVQASDTYKASALAEAYACIENEMVPTSPEANTESAKLLSEQTPGCPRKALEAIRDELIAFNGSRMHVVFDSNAHMVGHIDYRPVTDTLGIITRSDGFVSIDARRVVSWWPA